MLERIRDEKGNTCTAPTQCQIDNRNTSVGNPITAACLICRRYINQQGTLGTTRKTSFCCKDCKMPLCERSRVGQDGGHEITCIEEHCCSDNPFFGCNALIPKGKVVPEHEQINMWPRHSKRKRNK